MEESENVVKKLEKVKKDKEQETQNDVDLPAMGLPLPNNPITFREAVNTIQKHMLRRKIIGDFAKMLKQEHREEQQAKNPDQKSKGHTKNEPLQRTPSSKGGPGVNISPSKSKSQTKHKEPGPLAKSLAKLKDSRHLFEKPGMSKEEWLAFLDESESPTTDAASQQQNNNQQPYPEISTSGRYSRTVSYQRGHSSVQHFNRDVQPRTGGSASFEAQKLPRFSEMDQGSGTQQWISHLQKTHSAIPLRSRNSGQAKTEGSKQASLSQEINILDQQTLIPESVKRESTVQIKKWCANENKWEWISPSARF